MKKTIGNNLNIFRCMGKNPDELSSGYLMHRGQEREYERIQWKRLLSVRNLGGHLRILPTAIMFQTSQSLKPNWTFFCALNKITFLLPQGLCICYFFCLDKGFA